MNVSGSIKLDVGAIRRWVSSVNCNPRKKGVTDVSDRSCSSRSAAAINETWSKMLMFSLQLRKEPLL